jgi:cytochrome c-type biogenesis protein CcmH
VPRMSALIVLRAVAILVLLLGPAAAVYAIDPATLPDPKLEARYLALTHEFRCVTCQNTTIADSQVELAGQLRRQVREMLLAGKSDQQVRDYMTARYGDFILFRPRFAARTAWLWLAPGVMLIIGVLVALRVIRQRTALVADDNEPIEEDLRT